MTDPWPDDCGDGGDDFALSYSSSHNSFIILFNTLVSIYNSELEHFFILFISRDVVGLDFDLLDLLLHALALFLGFGALIANGVAVLAVEVWARNREIRNSL